MSIDDRLAEWRETLEQLERQVLHIHHRRELFHATVDLLQATPSNDGVFAQFLAGIYADAQVLAIRRLVDDNKRTVSFCRLIGQLMEHRRDFTVEWYIRRRVAEGNDARWDKRDAHEVLATYLDAPDSQHLGGRRLMADKKDLTDITERLTSYANQHVAHSDSEPTAAEVTFAESMPPSTTSACCSGNTRCCSAAWVWSRRHQSFSRTGHAPFERSGTYLDCGAACRETPAAVNSAPRLLLAARIFMHLPEQQNRLLPISSQSGLRMSGNVGHVRSTPATR
jgi:hypothetical protein